MITYMAMRWTCRTLKCGSNNFREKTSKRIANILTKMIYLSFESITDKNKTNLIHQTLIGGLQENYD